MGERAHACCLSLGGSGIRHILPLCDGLSLGK